MNPILFNMIVWGGLLLVGGLAASFLVAFAPFRVMAVRASMGRKCLVQFRTMGGSYYRTGKLDGDFLMVRARGDKRSEKRRIDLATASKELGASVFFEAFGVRCVVVDEQTSKALAPNLQGGGTHDPIKVDHLIKRAIMAPKIEARKEIVIIILLVLVLCGIIYIGVQTGKIQEALAVAQSVTPATN